MFSPMFDRIIIEPLAKNEEAEKIGSLYMAPTANQPYIKSLVVEAGPGIYLPDGTMRPIHVRKGEVVLHPEANILEYECGGENVKMICERDILCKWSPDPVEESKPVVLNESKKVKKAKK